MKIHWLQHVPFEGLGCIEPWLAENGHAVTCTRLWAGDLFPSIGKKQQALTQAAPNLGNVDGLIVMGGPMGIYDTDQHPWLAAEKAFIKEIIDQNKPVLGICLGAQLIADVLGAEVLPGQNKEIGFYPLAGDGEHFPEEFMAFHWHGDTFDIPDGAVRLASSEATENQAFLYKDNVLALQFHLETTEESLMALYENCSDEIEEALFFHSSEAREAGQPKAGRQRNEVKCQTLEEMQENFPILGNCNALMFDLLKQLFG